MSKFLNPTDLVKLSDMKLRAKVVVDGFMAGLHDSALKGLSLDFAEHREYVPGDELKYLDWKILGRTDRYYIKQYKEESTLISYILLDKSSSMGYASGKITKLQYASYLAASLTYLMLRQQDKVGLMLFNEKIAEYIPPKSALSHMKFIMNSLDNISSGGKTSIWEALENISGFMKKRGLIILISDLYDNEDKVLKYLKYLNSKKNEVIVFHILDNAELVLNFKEPFIFEGMEDKLRVLALPDMIRHEYKKLINEFINKHKSICEKNNIDYVLFDTLTPLEHGLIRYLEKRERLLK
ncbi:MAG: DUF58 domain-containing protein [Candidatus Firestonebacteria bacterium]